MSIEILEDEFQHILRILNTNIDGRIKVPYALKSIKGLGKRFSFAICKKAEVDVHRRAGTLTPDEIGRLVAIMQNPSAFRIPDWFLNRKNDPKDGKTTQLISNMCDARLRDDLDKLKKIRCHRGLRHMWGLRVRGQHTKTTGRRGRTVGVSKKK
eukprot:NODE_5576_length_637_cov_1884.547059_g5412_i0.p1 GENE.NODE_5576_length_637_cov_1884.547059_g5412_i0~~NODE_5576_length_637_cov_1884.547059_g5412_i0.p1  ORF type:complete len:154 (+),score=8.25 NODE_5576_length_637_cov_1884.547059_g5412_i0:80-541(+)